MDISTALTEQQRYYDERAPEYDDWWLRRGRFDEGAEANARWQVEAEMVRSALVCADVSGDILELAAGTGIWSRQLLTRARTLTVVDGSKEMLSLNPVIGREGVAAVQADLFVWQPLRRFDAVAFAFWISHVPRELVDSFLARVPSFLNTGGKVFFVDNLPDPEASAPHVLGSQGQFMSRRLNDGRTATIIKNYYASEFLRERCARVGLDVSVHETPSLFQYGIGHKI